MEGRGFWLAISGLCGASAAIKWNGLWFLLGAYYLDGSLVMRWVQSLQHSAPDQHESVGIQTP